MSDNYHCSTENILRSKKEDYHTIAHNFHENYFLWSRDSIFISENVTFIYQTKKRVFFEIHMELYAHENFFITNAFQQCFLSDPTQESYL